MAVNLIAKRHPMGGDLDTPYAVVLGEYQEHDAGALYVIENVPVNVHAEAFIAYLEGISPEWEANDRPRGLGASVWIVWAVDAYDEDGNSEMSPPIYASPMSAYTDHRTAHAVVRKIRGYLEYGNEPGEFPAYWASIRKVPVIGATPPTFDDAPTDTAAIADACKQALEGWNDEL